MKKGTRILLIILAILIVIAALAYAVFHHYVSMLNYVPLDEEESSESTETASSIRRAVLKPLQATEPINPNYQIWDGMGDEEVYDYSSKDVMNILLIGVDNDYIEGIDLRGNADGLIIASINKTDKRLVLSSLMRDIYARYPDSGTGTKLTLIYHQKGTKELIDSIEQNFKIPIHNYALVNYLNVIDIVDALGGLGLELYEEEIVSMEEKIINLNQMLGLDPQENILTPDQAGMVHLNGVQTAAYLRIRYAGNGDFERTERARRVIGLAMEKLKKMSLLDYNRLANTILPCITTDLNEREILSLILNGQKYMKYEQVSVRIPIEDSYSMGHEGAVVRINYPVNRAFLHDTICGD